MTSAVKEFVEEAREVTVAEAAERLGLKFTGRRHEHPQPCPACGGTDTFAFNTEKNKWNCRNGGIGGQDAIGMAAHVLDLDAKTREGLLEACAAVTGREIPDGGERESAEDRATRKARLEERRQQNLREMAEREASQNAFRDRERDKARGIYEAAPPLGTAGFPHGRLYLQGRGGGVPDDRWLRVSPDLPYWHGQDEMGRSMQLYSGPAMIAPFVDAGGAVIGCHITWIDLEAPPKLRPALRDPDTGEPLPTKKMRGTKKGGVIPLAGSMSAARWVGAEGIENTLAFARWEGFRADTFYFAAGDLGNMAGPADPKSKRAHPTLRKTDKLGRERPVMVPGPVPLIRPGGEPDAMVVPAHVVELALLGDGDSEPVMTAAAMVRAKARHARPGRLIPVVMPRPGTDFAALLAGHPAAYADDREVDA